MSAIKLNIGCSGKIHIINPKSNPIKTTLQLCFYLIFITLGLVGCSGKKEVSGQVFIQNGNTSQKIALVDIFVVDRKSLGEISYPIVAQYFTNRAEIKTLKDLRNEIDRMRSKVPENLQPKLSQVSKQITERLQDAMGIEGAYRSMINHVLPPVTTQTDADGMFKVRASNTDLLVARKYRPSLDARDSHFWILSAEKINLNVLFSDPEILKDDWSLILALAEKALPNVINTEKLEELVFGTESSESLKQWAREQRQTARSLLKEAEEKTNR